MPRGAARLAFPAVLLVGLALVLPLCDWLHLCGCREAWAGGATKCNVHEASGPHCPWCEHPVLGALAALATTFGQWAVFRRACRSGACALAAAAASLAALPALIVIVGALAWLPTDYPHFLVPDARLRLGLPRGPIPTWARPGRAAVATCCAPRRTSR